MDEKTRRIMFSSDSDEWATPDDFFAYCEERFGKFDLDPCASDENHKCDNYYTIEDDGLSKEWHGKVFVNPPYSQMETWIKKAYEESRRSDTIVYFLCPARTDTKWFHNFALKAKELYFIKGRLKFKRPDKDKAVGAPFPSMLIRFDYAFGIPKIYALDWRKKK